MRQTAKILGVNVDTLSMDETLKKIQEFIDGNSLKTIFTPNSEIIMNAKENEKIKEILNNGDLVIADGIGVVLASKFLKTPIPERVTGFDTMSNLLKLGKNGEISFYLFGGSPGIAETAQKKLESMYPEINIVGTYNGYFSQEEEKNIVNEINELSPDVLFVALGSPKQEKWIYKYKDILNVKVCMGVGGSFDVLAGKVKRAPQIFQSLGLEWFYRFVKQPSRYKRILKLPQFVLHVLFQRFKTFSD